MPSPIFIGGVPRSGTTLLRIMLDSHPNIYCGPELRATASIMQLWQDTCATRGQDMEQYYHYSPKDLKNSFKKLYLSFLENALHKSGKRRIAEKTPSNLLHFRALHEMFPKSPLIHIIRDSRDVICSLLEMDWTDSKTGKPLPYTQDVEIAALTWVQMVIQGRNMVMDDDLKDVYYEIRYEDIITKPESVLKKLFDFIGEPWDEAILSYYKKNHVLGGNDESSAKQVTKNLYHNSMCRWKTDLSDGDQDKVMKIAGPLLIELGYETGTHL